jgi:hypothetical protein
LGGVFAKNTSLEIKFPSPKFSLKTGIFRKYPSTKSVVAEKMSADGEPARGRTIILTDSARKRDEKRSQTP